MSEEIGPQTKAAIKKMKWVPDPGAAWGRRSLLTLPIGFGIIILLLILVKTTLGENSRGWGYVALFIPIIYGVPVVVAVGLFFSVVGLYRDAERKLASIGFAIWSVLGLGAAYFLMKMFK